MKDGNTCFLHRRISGKADNFVGMLHDTQYGAPRNSIPDLEAMKHSFGNYTPAIDLSKIKVHHSESRSVSDWLNHPLYRISIGL